MKTDRAVSLGIQEKAGGEYVHMGVKKGIQNHITSTIDQSDMLVFIVNIDGLPIFKSSGLSFWPILMRIANANYNKPFVVGLFSGITKPKNIEEYLSDFVSEMTSVLTDGVTVGNRHFRVVLKCIIANAPALAMIKCIKSHCGYFGCPRCIQEGSPAANCIVFLNRFLAAH